MTAARDLLDALTTRPRHTRRHVGEVAADQTGAGSGEVWVVFDPADEAQLCTWTGTPVHAGAVVEAVFRPGQGVPIVREVT